MMMFTVKKPPNVIISEGNIIDKTLSNVNNNDKKQKCT